MPLALALLALLAAPKAIGPLFDALAWAVSVASALILLTLIAPACVRRALLGDLQDSGLKK